MSRRRGGRSWRRVVWQRQVDGGFWRAPMRGVCGYCDRPIKIGDLIRKVPDDFRPGSQRRHAHYHCIQSLITRFPEANKTSPTEARDDA